MEALIRSKVEGYSGLVACVPFVDGKAEAEISKSQLAYFKRAGYDVKILKGDAPKGDADVSGDEPESTDGAGGDAAGKK